MAEESNQVWDVTTDPSNPQPLIWPECTHVTKKTGDVCNTPFVWRHAYSFSKGYMWAWMRDCKHRSGEYRMMTKDGEYTPGE